MAHRWITEQHQLDALVDELAATEAYGVDTEFHRERSYYPRLALLQLAWPSGVALVDALAVDLRPLARVLQGPGVAVLHAAEQDLEVLERACGAVPSRLFDTQVAAGLLGFSSPSLGTLVERVLGVRLAKGDRLTDWTRRPLTDEQLRYAAADVADLPLLHQRLAELLEERGRTFYWLAKKTGISHTTLWRLKKGKALGINFGTLEGICSALECQPGDVLRLAGGGRGKRRDGGKGAGRKD